MTSAQTAFAALIAVFGIAGALLLDAGTAPTAGWLFVAASLIGFVMLGVMIVLSAIATARAANTE